MSYFSAALHTILEQSKLPQRQAALAASVQAPLFNSYMHGRHRPSLENLEKICAIFEEPDRIALLKAHLEDEIPAGSRHLLQIRPNTVPTAEDVDFESQLLAGLTPDAARAFKFLIALSRKNYEVQEWIIGAARIIKDEASKGS
jgi:transcriptional regulator with XRE-family HTH domain